MGEIGFRFGLRVGWMWGFSGRILGEDDPVRTAGDFHDIRIVQALVSKVFGELGTQTRDLYADSRVLAGVEVGSPPQTFRGDLILL